MCDPVHTRSAHNSESPGVPPLRTPRLMRVNVSESVPLRWKSQADSRNRKNSKLRDLNPAVYIGASDETVK